MTLNGITESLLFKASSVLVAMNVGYTTSAVGVNAVFTSLGEKIRDISRLPKGQYTTEPTAPYLGKHPGRSPETRGGMWPKGTSLGNSGGGHHLIALSKLLTGHTVAVSPAPGGAYSWEGSSSGAGGDLNTGNGNFLTKLHLLDWKSRGLNIDFTLYHNSETNYVGELGAGWTWTYDIYINNLTGSPVVHWGDGLSIPYSVSGSTYSPPSGIYDKLVQNTGGTWTLTKTNGTKYNFNTSGFCTSIVDTNGNTITISLNAGNYCTGITDPTGKTLTINLNGSNQFSSIVDPIGRTWTFTESGGELTNVAWPALSGTIYSDAYTYNSNNDILTHTDKRGNVWTKTYNSDGSIATETDPLSHTTSYSYSSSATTITDPLSHTRIDNYSSGVLASSQDESGFSISYSTRDTNYNPTTIVDKKGSAWGYSYDSAGNCLTITNPLSNKWIWTYSGLAKPLTATDPLGDVTQFSYDSSGNLLVVKDPLGHAVQTNTYDTYGELASSTDAMGDRTVLSYTAGALSSITDPNGNTANIAVDGINRFLSVSDPLSHTEKLSYDVWGRTSTQTHSDSKVVSSYWDNEGNLITLVDENGNSQNWTYDAANREIDGSNARGDTETYGYDNADRRTTITDGNGHSRSFTYTNRGEISTLTMADGSEEMWAYDGNGNNTAYVNPLSQTIDYVFDLANRKTTIDYPSGTNTSFNFDSSDRQTGMTDSTGSTTWGYDVCSRVTNLNTPQGNLTYGYDNASRRTSLLEGVGTTTYSYDLNSHLAAVTNPYSETTTLAYDAAGNLSTKTFASGVYDTFAYDARNRLTGLNHRNSAGLLLSSESYAYDSTSNITAKTVDSVTSTYTYDAAYQLLNESRTGYSASYTYDYNGNRTSQTLNGTLYSYSYDSGDKLTVVSTGGSVVKSYTYDTAGRTTAVASPTGTTRLTYDYEDRVSGITYPGSSTNSFSYNGLDTRVGKVDSTGTSTYKHDGADVTDPVLSDGSIAYTPGVSQRKSGVSTFDHRDYLGSFTRQTNASQATTATRIFDAFGNLESTTGTPQSSFGFVGASGYQSDPDSSLQLLGHRYYDASTGRFLTRDQAKQGRNWYSYCAGMPTAARDPDGHFLILIAIVVVFILAAETAHTPTSPTDIPPPGWAGGKKLAAVYQLVPMMVEGPAGEGPGDGGYTDWPRDTSLPWEGGPPGGTIRGIKKTRRYGDDGFPDVDRDWDPTHNPPDHAHDVGRPQGGGRPEHEHRGPLRPVRPGDPPPPWGKPGEPPPRLP